MARTRDAKTTERELQLELKVTELEQKLQRAKDEMREMKKKRDSSSITSMSTTSTAAIAPMGHKGYLFRWLVRGTYRRGGCLQVFR